MQISCVNVHGTLSGHFIAKYENQTYFTVDENLHIHNVNIVVSNNNTIMTVTFNFGDLPSVRLMRRP